MISLSETSCGNCRFLDDKSRCRKKAPKPLYAIDSERHDIVVNWPSVAEEDWCGEFVLHPDLEGEK